MKTRREILSTKAYGKIYKEAHLAELKELLSSPIKEENFMTVEYTNELMHRERTYNLKLKKITLFSDKCVLCNIIDNIASYCNGYVLFFSYYSEYCGMYVLDSILQFNCNFEYFYLKGGVISLIEINNNNCLSVDFYEENGEYWMDIGVYGDLWCSAVKDITDWM